MLKHNLKFKFGLGALLRNPLRIIAAFFTAVIAIGIAGLCIFTDTYDMLVWEKNIFLNYNDDWYITISVDNAEMSQVSASTSNGLATSGMVYEDYKTLLHELDGMNTGYATVLWSSVTYEVEEADHIFSVYHLADYLGDNAELDEKDGHTVYYEYNGRQLFAPYISKTKYSYDGTDSDREFTYNAELYYDLFGAMTIYSGQNALDEFGYTLVGKLPEKVNEVAIPQWLYNSFLCYGYNDPATNKVTAINSEEDIIGKTLQLAGDFPPDYEGGTFEATIVGVVHSDCENDPAFANIKEIAGKLNLSDEYSIAPQTGIVICSDFFEEYNGNKTRTCVVISRISGRAEEYFDYLTSWRKGSSYRKIVDPDAWPEIYVNYGMPYSILKLYTNLSTVFDSTTIYLKIVPFLVPLAIVLLIYLSVSTAVGRRREIGIIRSLGMENSKILLSLFIPLVVMAIAVSLVGLGVELAFLNYMNNYLFDVAQKALTTGFYPFTLTPPTLLFTFLSPVLTVGISLAVTMAVLARRPIRALVAK